MTNEQMREFEEWAEDYCLTDGPSKQDCFFSWQAATAKANQWRPIADAPKDVHVLLWVDIALGKPLIVQGCWFSISKQEQGWIDMDGTVVPVTYWMPLPLPPKSTK